MGLAWRIFGLLALVSIIGIPRRIFWIDCQKRSALRYLTGLKHF
jgi:hypothetical protein